MCAFTVWLVIKKVSLISSLVLPLRTSVRILSSLFVRMLRFSFIVVSILKRFNVIIKSYYKHKTLIIIPILVFLQNFTIVKNLGIIRILFFFLKFVKNFKFFNIFSEKILPMIFHWIIIFFGKNRRNKWVAFVQIVSI